MQVIPLGTSSGVPTRQRGVAGHAILLRRRWLLVDCGEGTQVRIQQARLSLKRLEAVLISHLHADHVLGLLGLINTLSLQGPLRHLPIYGPSGICDLVSEFRSRTHAKALVALEFHEIDEQRGSDILRSTGTHQIRFMPLEHRAPAYGYRIDSLGFDEEDHIPFRSIAYCSDTRPCRNAIELARHADLLIHESTYTEAMARKAHLRGHSTAMDAARVAKEAGVRALLLTHFSPRYRDPDQLANEARSIFPASFAARDLVPFDAETAFSRITDLKVA